MDACSPLPSMTYQAQVARAPKRVIRCDHERTRSQFLVRGVPEGPLVVSRAFKCKSGDEEDQERANREARALLATLK